VAENLQALLALGRQLRSEAAEGQREQEPTRRRGDGAGNDQRGRRHLGVAEPKEDEHRPRRRPERRQEIDPEDHGDGEEQVQNHRATLRGPGASLVFVRPPFGAQFRGPARLGEGVEKVGAGEAVPEQ
jgi:hypothetical protein